MRRFRFMDGRSTGPFTLSSDKYYRTPDCNAALGWHTLATYNANGSCGSYSTMLDHVIPNYGKRSKGGEVFFNPLTQVKMSISFGTGQTPTYKEVAYSCSGANTYQALWRFPLTGVSFGRHTSGFAFVVMPDGSLTGPSLGISNVDQEGALAEATTSCLNSIGRGASSSNLYETLAEADKILGTVPSIVKGGLNGAFFSKGILARAKSLGSGYLAYRYGLKPLMSDIEAVTQGLQKVLGKVRQTSRGKVVLKNNYSTIQSANFGGSDTYTQCRAYNEQFTARAMSLEEYYADVGSNVGFSLKNLATVPWELVPYSFVVDWFVNIGDFLGALVPNVGYDHLGSCIVLEWYQETSYTAYNMTPLSNVLLTAPGSGSCERVWSHKTRYPSGLAPRLVIKSDFRFSNLTRALDAISLVLQRIK